MFAWKSCAFIAQHGETRVRPDRNSLIKHTASILGKTGGTNVSHEDDGERITWHCDIPLSEEKRQRVHAAFIETFGPDTAKDFCWYGTETRVETFVAVALGDHVQ